MVIGEHTDHKARGYSTITFAAPVEINGARGNMAVVVREEGKNYYKMHKIIMPDGSAFVYEKNRNSAERVGQSSMVEDTLSPTDTVSDDSIAPYEQSVNTDISDKIKESVTPSAKKIAVVGSKPLDVTLSEDSIAPYEQSVNTNISENAQNDTEGHLIAALPVDKLLDLYDLTAGKIESRDTENRRNLTAEQRKNIRLDIDRTDVVFAGDGVSYSIAKDNGGNNVVVIDTDQGLFVGADESEYRKIAKDYLNEHFKNAILPLSDYGLVAVNKTGIGKYAYSGKKLENSANNAKMRAATELDNLLRTAEYVKSSGDRKNHNFAADGFDYYKTKFIVDGQVFEGIVDIGVSEKGAEFYGITNIENVTSRYYGKYSNLLLGYKSVTQSDIFDITVPQNEQSVNTNISDKIKKGHPKPLCKMQEAIEMGCLMTLQYHKMNSLSIPIYPKMRKMIPKNIRLPLFRSTSCLIYTI